jgi:hypothetical protein
MAENSDQGKTSFLRSAPGIALLVFGGVAGFFLVMEHRAHLYGVLPFLVLALCPLMHFFMHRGHGGHGGHGRSSANPNEPHAGHRQGDER